MKKFKKIFAIVLAMAIILGMSVTAFADTTAQPGNITVNGLTTEEAVTATAYQVLEFDAAAGAWKLTNWAKTALGENAATALGVLTTEANSNGSTIAGYLTTLAAASGKVEVATDTTSATGDVYADSITLATAELGSYLVICTSENWSYTNMLINNYDYDRTNGNVLKVGTGTAKGTHNNVIDEKKVTTETDAQVAVGDIIGYTVTGTFPHFEGYSEPSFKITDTMSENLVPYTTGENGAWTNNDITIKIGGTAIESGAYTVETTDKGFEINFKQSWLIDNAKNYAEATGADRKIEITYSARVTGYVATGYKNTVESTIKTDNTGEKEGDPHETTSYTAALELRKIDSANNNALAGATFVLRTTDNGATKYVKFTTVDGVTDMELVDEADDATPFETNEQGVISVEGLDPDYEYTLTETVAPNGYSKATAEATIKFVPSETDEGKYTATLTAEGNEWALGNNSGTNASEKPQVVLSDTRLSSLPSTGGIGTTIFTIGGCAIIIVAAGLFFASRRKKSA
ncbi:MAG: isopeptide-forming domain-containing fimbrial protein [Eubacterium sp.]|nr:isopeptide-forming domain-containing fimbrial protein [Eubacterium sp.]